jgi:hypothetical protein
LVAVVDVGLTQLQQNRAAVKRLMWLYLKQVVAVVPSD